MANQDLLKEEYSMKKYTSHATKWLAIFAVVSIVMLLIGIILIIVNFSNTDLQFGLTMSGGLMSVLFLTCFFADKSRCLTISNDKIILPRGADNNGKIVFKKTIISIDKISSIESRLYKGNLFSKDTYFHMLKLKDGTKISFTLYAYGKEAEKEILKTIKDYLRNSNSCH